MTRAVLSVVVVLAALAPPAAASARLDQLVVFRSGAAKLTHPVIAQTTVKVKGRRCAVAGGTPLAALVHSGIGPLSLRDYGACSKRPADSGGLFVAAIGPDRNKGSDGWVYKAGNLLGTAGAADPAGPLGRGRLHSGADVTWFWCHVANATKGCPHTLTVAAVTSGVGTLDVRVRQWDDHGNGSAASGAIVHAGSHTAMAGADGVAHFTLPAGGYSVYSDQAGRIRSFTARMTVR